MKRLKPIPDEPLLNNIYVLCSVTIQLEYFRLAVTWITLAIILHCVAI